ncbi:MAG: hypothetical protein R3D85_08985 [Paracoccaceae bacterium]
MEQEISRRGAAFRYRLENGRVVFEDEMRYATSGGGVTWVFLRRTRPMVLLTAPVIYSLDPALRAADLFTGPSGGLLSGLWHPQGAALRSYPHRPASPGLFNGFRRS